MIWWISLFHILTRWTDLLWSEQKEKWKSLLKSFQKYQTIRENKILLKNWFKPFDGLVLLSHFRIKMMPQRYWEIKREPLTRTLQFALILETWTQKSNPMDKDWEFEKMGLKLKSENFKMENLQVLEDKRFITERFMKDRLKMASLMEWESSLNKEITSFYSMKDHSIKGTDTAQEYFLWITTLHILVIFKTISFRDSEHIDILTLTIQKKSILILASFSKTNFKACLESI